MSVLLLTCPRDHGILASNDTGSCRYHSCERCCGYWISGRVLARVLLPQSIEELRSTPSVPSELKCPDCRAECRAVTVEGCVLDRCPRCEGVWLDGGEVPRVKRLFPKESPVLMAEEDRERLRQEMEAYAGENGSGNLLFLLSLLG